MMNRKKVMKITVETKVAAPIEKVWDAWTTPEDIKRWNAASDDWHTTKATFTRIEKHKLIESTFGDRALLVEFLSGKDGVTVRETFDAETTNPVEHQRQGWQAILNNFAKHVEGRN
jgi:hypothetical protein